MKDWKGFGGECSETNDLILLVGDDSITALDDGLIFNTVVLYGAIDIPGRGG